MENWHFVHYGPVWGGGRQGLKLWLYNSSILWRVVLHMRARATPRQLDERVWYRGDDLAVRFDNRCRETDLSRVEVREGLDLQKEAMVQAKTFAEEQGATLVVALFPTKEVTYWKQLQEVGPSWTVGCDLVAPYRVISDLAHGLGIPVIDLVPAFTASAARKEQVYFPQNDHWNSAGNRTAFSAIKNALMDRNLAKGLSHPTRDSNAAFNMQGSRGSEE